MKHNEDLLQAACVRWFRLQYPDVVLFAIPNGGLRSAVTGALMKATGTLAGVADLFVMKGKFKVHFVNKIETTTNQYTGIEYTHGLFIEMKAGKGVQTEAQKAFQKHAEAAGFQYSVCRSVDEFMQVVNKYLKP